MRAARALLGVLLVGAAFAKTSAQRVPQADLDAWRVRNDYQPGRDWRGYLDIVPGNMGPNALPVPQTLRGRVDTASTVTLAANGHRRSGERVADLTGEVRVAFGARASLRVRYTGLEAYRTDSSLVRARNALELDGRGLAAGDVHVTAHFQLVRAHGGWPDLALSARTRTASGTRLVALRYSDGPGYAFDVSVGRDYRLGARGPGNQGPRLVLRPYGQLGFYVWQRPGNPEPQDDAISHALGLELRRETWNAYLESAGYIGYEGVLDQPLVLRAGVEWAPARFRVSVEVQRGVRDFAYTSMGLGLTYRISRRAPPAGVSTE